MAAVWRSALTWASGGRRASRQPVLIPRARFLPLPPSWAMPMAWDASVAQRARVVRRAAKRGCLVYKVVGIRIFASSSCMGAAWAEFLPRRWPVPPEWAVGAAKWGMGGADEVPAVSVFCMEKKDELPAAELAPVVVGSCGGAVGPGGSSSSIGSSALPQSGGVSSLMGASIGSLGEGLAVAAGRIGGGVLVSMGVAT